MGSRGRVQDRTGRLLSLIVIVILLGLGSWRLRVRLRLRLGRNHSALIQWQWGKGEWIPISRANPMEGAPLPSPLPARTSQGEGAGGGDGGILMRPFNRLRYFRFAAIGRVIILAVMAYRTFISSGSILAAFQAVAAEQTSTAVVDKGTKSLDWWKEKISHYVDTHGPALAGAVIVLVAGFYASRLLGRFLASWLDQKPIEPPVRLLMVRVTRLLVIVLAL